MKHPISEVVFPLCGEWVVEAYAWSKELARQLDISFQAIRFVTDYSDSESNPAHLALEGDGYYYVHYNNTPPKTRIENVKGSFDFQFLNFMKERKGSIIVMPADLVSPKLYDDLVALQKHALVSFPNQFVKSEDANEFNNILKQVSFRHVPFDLFRPENYSLISRLTKGLLAFI